VHHPSVANQVPPEPVEIGDVRWGRLLDENWAVFWVAIAFVWHTAPLGTFFLLAALQTIPPDLYRAARIDRAGLWSRLRHVTLPILLPGIIGVAMGAFTLSYDEYARTTLVIGERNTLPLEIYALISSATSPTLFAIGTITTGVSFLVIGLTLWRILRLQRRRAGAMPS